MGTAGVFESKRQKRRKNDVINRKRENDYPQSQESLY